jgi:hypothetical protein
VTLTKKIQANSTLERRKRELREKEYICLYCATQTVSQNAGAV